MFADLSSGPHQVSVPNEAERFAVQRQRQCTGRLTPDLSPFASPVFVFLPPLSRFNAREVPWPCLVLAARTSENVNGFKRDCHGS